MVEQDGFILGCGVAIMNGSKVLLGERSDGQGWCMAGGKLEKGELPSEAAKRELTEEFGLIAEKVDLLGVIESQAKVKGVLRNVRSYIFATSTYTGNIRPCDEILDFKWEDVLTMNFEDKSLFLPTQKAIKLVREFFQ